MIQILKKGKIKIVLIFLLLILVYKYTIKLTYNEFVTYNQLKRESIVIEGKIKKVDINSEKFNSKEKSDNLLQLSFIDYITALGKENDVLINEISTSIIEKKEEVLIENRSVVFTGDYKHAVSLIKQCALLNSVYCLKSIQFKRTQQYDKKEVILKFRLYFQYLFKENNEKSKS